MTKRELYNGIVGIDLGTTFSVVAVWDNDTKSTRVIENSEGSLLTPSIVAFTETERLVGESARKFGTIANNQESCFYETKRLMGKCMSEVNQSDYNYKICGDQYDKVMVCLPDGRKMYPYEIAAAVLTKMKDTVETSLGKEIKDAIITVPAYFNNDQRVATKTAATIAGLNCVRIINEPTAACLTFGLHKKNISKILIIDKGGSTVDISVLSLKNSIFKVIAVNGDPELGGKDFDKVIETHLASEFKKKTSFEIPITHLNKLKILAETTKKELSSALSTFVEMDFCGHSCTIRMTRLEFENLAKSAGLLDRCIEPIKNVLLDAELTYADIDEVVLVGGSTRIPIIQKLISAFFQGKQLNCSISADTAIATGAAIQGTMLSDYDTTGTVNELILVDVIPLSLGVKLSNGLMDVLIPKNSSIPTSKVKQYSTSDNYQTFVKIVVYEGNRPFAKDCHQLGSFELTDLPKNLEKGKLKIDVSFNIDEDGILTVAATTDDNQSSLTITAVNQLSSEEITYMIESADKYKQRDQYALQQLATTKDLEDYVNSQQYLVNSPDANLSQEIISNANQMLMQTIDWLYQTDVVTGELPSPQQIEECKIALKYHMDQIPWTQAWSNPDALNHFKVEEEKPMTTNDINDMLATL